MKESLIDPNTKTIVEGRPEVPKSDIVPQKVCVHKQLIRLDGYLQCIQVLDYYVSQYKQRGAGTSLNLYKRFEYQFEDNKGMFIVFNQEERNC